MSEITSEYLIAIAICSPLFFFILAVTFRLLDNSAGIFLNQEILIGSSYISKDIITEYLNHTQDTKLKRALKRALIYKKLHNLFMILAILALPSVIIICFLLI